MAHEPLRTVRTEGREGRAELQRTDARRAVTDGDVVLVIPVGERDVSDRSGQRTHGYVGPGRRTDRGQRHAAGGREVQIGRRAVAAEVGIELEAHATALEAEIVAG